MISVETIRMPDGTILAPKTYDEAYECCSKGGIWTGQMAEVEEPKPGANLEGDKKPRKGGRKPKNASQPTGETITAESEGDGDGEGDESDSEDGE